MTLCRVRATNHGSRVLAGALDRLRGARARGGGVAVRERGRFGLALAPYGSLETLIGFRAGTTASKSSPIAPGDDDPRERKPRKAGSGGEEARAPAARVRRYNAAE